ncbi:MAG: hypothetical protein HYS43_01920 [Candidatus Liptonbacteria bacterium]|nr:hypothetical protein [Candidatus Liptonbacteria bacterium]
MNTFVSGKVAAGAFAVAAGIAGALFIIGAGAPNDSVRPQSADYGIDAGKLAQKKPFVERVADAATRAFGGSAERNYTTELGKLLGRDLIQKNPENFSTDLDFAVIDDFLAKTLVSMSGVVSDHTLVIVDDESIGAIVAHRTAFRALVDEFNREIAPREAFLAVAQDAAPAAMLAELADLYRNFVAKAVAIPVPRAWAPLFQEEVSFLDAKRGAYETAGDQLQRDPVAAAVALQSVQQRELDFLEAERRIEAKMEIMNLGRIADLERIFLAHQ